MSHLFTIGPVEMYPETLEIGGKQVPYFRNDECSQVVLSASEGLNRLLFNEKGKVILIDEKGEKEIPLLKTQDIFKLFIDRITDGKSGISMEESIYATEIALRCR